MDEPPRDLDAEREVNERAADEVDTNGGAGSNGAMRIFSLLR